MARATVGEARSATIEAARDQLADLGPHRIESVALEQANGRFLVTDVVAPHDLPPFATAAMDGFALLPHPAGSVLRLVGESRAGAPFDGVPAGGETIAISTGALAPEGVGVAPVETVDEGMDGATVEIRGDVALGDHVRGAGEDLRSGEIALAAGTRLGPAELAVAATCGVAEVECAVPPRVAIVVTGDELVPPGDQLTPGTIHESNGVSLAALCSDAGARVTAVIRAADEFEPTREALASALGQSDVVIASGGVSVGAHDHVRPALGALGVEEVFAGVSLKPGGPTWFGRSAAGQLVFGLPGNPASAFVTFQLFAAPAIRTLLGAPTLPRQWPCELTEAIGLRDREQAIRVTVEPRPDGVPLATPTGSQGSHRTASLSGAWGLAMLPAGSGEAPAGSVVQVEPIRS